MANPALGGILSGLMQGYDYQNELNHQRDEREYQKNRRAVTDAQQDQRFGADMTGLNQRNQLGALELENAPAKYQRDAALGYAQIKGYGLRNAMDQFQLDRAPTVAKQQDAEFALNQQAKRGQIGLQGMQAQLARMGLDEKKIDQQRRQSQEALVGGITQGRMTGDWSGLVSAYNKTVGNHFGAAPLESITQNQDGTFTAASSNGTLTHLSGVDQLMDVAGAVTSPETYVKGLFDRHFGDKNDPADIRSARELAKGMQRNPGESDAQLLNRAYDRVRAKGYMDPADLHAKIYQSAMTALKDDFNMTPEQKSAAAMEQADKYVEAVMARGGREAGGGTGFAAAAQGAVPQWADPGNGVTPPPRFAQPSSETPSAGVGSHGRVVRTGVKNGQRVALYEDGSILPLQ